MAVETPSVPGGDAPEVIPPPPAQPPPLSSSPPQLPVTAPPAARRGRNRILWFGAVLVAVVVTLGAIGLLFIDDQSWQRQANQARSENASLKDQLTTAQSSASDAQQQVKDLKAKLAHPSLGIWNVAQQIRGPDDYLIGGIPDTFTYHLNATSSGPMNVSIETFENFASGIECIDSGRGNTDFCMHHSGTVKTWALTRSVSYDFHLAEGCAGYMVVFTAPSAVTVQPDVSVTYNPAPTFTGDC